MKIPQRHLTWKIAGWSILAAACFWVHLEIRRTGDDGQPPLQGEQGSRNSRGGPSRRGDSGAPPKETLRILLTRHPSFERDQALCQKVAQWAEAAPDEAVVWTESLPAGELRDWAVCAVVTAIANQDGRRASKILEVSIPEGLARNHALVSIAQRWAQYEPDAARGWLSDMENSSAKADALREIAAIRPEE